jgi:hypothetical protein
MLLKRIYDYFGGGGRYEAPITSKIYADTRGEDAGTSLYDRDALTTLALDCYRNNSICRFLVQKHLQFVSRFDYYVSGDKALSDKFYEKCLSADHRGRSLWQLLDLIETTRVLQGDCLVIVGTEGLQVIEGTNIKTPVGGVDGTDWVQGVRVNEWGDVLGYNIRNRESDVFVPAEHAFLIGYFYRPNQYRGITPLSSVLDSFKKLHQAVSYALNKAKLCQAVGVVTKRTSTNDDSGKELSDVLKERFGEGTVYFDFQVGEDAQMMTESTPSTEFQSFVSKVIEMTLASLEIPYCFYDSAHSNFYGTKGAFDTFIDSAQKKQEAYLPMLRAFTKSILGDQDAAKVEWRGSHLPSWRLYEDSKQIGNAILTGLSSLQESGKQYGVDVFDAAADMKEYLKNLPEGVPNVFSSQGETKTKREKIEIEGAMNETITVQRPVVDSINLNY